MPADKNAGAILSLGFGSSSNIRQHMPTTGASMASGRDQPGSRTPISRGRCPAVNIPVAAAPAAASRPLLRATRNGTEEESRKREEPEPN